VRINLFLYHRLPVIIYCALIFYLSSRPAPEAIPEFPHLDKLLYLSAYMACGALFLRAFRTFSIGANLKLVLMLSITASGLYGLSDEIHQYFIPCRSADFMDFMADIIGSICGVFIYQMLYPHRPKKLMTS